MILSAKKIVAWLLGISLFISCVWPVTAMAALGDTFVDDNGYHYKIIDDQEVAFISDVPNYGNATYSGEVTIPQTVEYDGTTYTVTAVDEYAFFTCSGVTKVSLPSTVKTIGKNAFYRCGALTEVVLNEGLASIGDSAFSECTNLSTLKLPSTLTAIGSGAFSQCSTLENLTIPASVTSGLGKALSSYPNGDTVTFAEGSPYYVATGVLYNKNSNTLELWLDQSVTDVVIPEGITEIPAMAFGSNVVGMQAELQSITLPSSVKKIGANAFQNSGISAIDLSNVEEIGNNAFMKCTTLDNVIWPEKLTSLGTKAFSDCKALTKVEIKGNLSSIPNNAFMNCSAVKQISLSEGITSIGAAAFWNSTSLESINIPASVQSIGNKFISTASEGNTIIVFEGEVPPTFTDTSFQGVVATNATVYFPANAADAYTSVDSALVTAGLVTTPSEGEVPSNSYFLEVTAPTTTLYSGDQLALDVISTIPSGGKLEAQSSNPDVAQVTVQDGKVTVKSLSKGSATITLSIYDSNGILLTSKTVDLTFSEPPYTGKYSYEISVAQPDNGSVDVDKYATEGETVTITATPDDGYMLDTLSVTAGGKELEVIDNGDGTYSFTMPSSKVSITAAFTEDPDWVDPEQPEEPGTTTVADIFNDVVPDAWYTDAVQYAYDNGLMTGTSATTFEPNTTTTRGMIVSMLHRLEGSPAVGIADFSDVASGDWYADPVAWAASEGIVGGYGDGTFGPNDPITREQMASILYRYADYKGLDVSARASLDAYSDADSVSPWASDVMSWAVSEGIISGMTEDTLAPQGTATRAQVAAMFQRFLEHVMA
ncbi:MAG: leucine-rich repeat protein [Peptococcaceae bacterium]|nr:leucine-rich repeat protein [Peptococcaceae bacterium]